VGTTSVVYTVTDNSGNITEDSFLVTIHDVDSPDIDNMPADIVVNNDEGACGALVSWTEPSSWDNCEVVDLSSDHLNGGMFPVGTTTVTYTATDSSDLQYSESFNVTVNDVEAPVLVGLVENVTFSNELGLCSGLATWDAPSGTDNCGETTITSTHEPGWSFNVGNTLVTYTVTDQYLNSSQNTLLVTIEDNEAPTFVSAPDFITATTDPGTCTTFVDWEVPVVDDNCGIFSLSTSNLRGTEFGVGVTEVTYTATDINGNSTMHSFVITVADDEMPVIEPVPEVVEVNTETGQCNAAAHWEDPSASDNCGILSYESTHQSGEIFDLGSTTVTITTTDIHFNVTTESFDVVVTDAEMPVFTSFPANIDLIAEPGLCSAVAQWEDAQGSDNCGVAGITTNRQPGEHFDVGMTPVTFTLTDVNGNVTEQVMNITVTDLEAPVITNLPPRVTVGTEPGICLGTTSWIEPNTSDNCAVLSLEADVVSGAMLPIGDTPVTYTVTDIHGNSSSQSFIVTVQDQELPQITNVPADITQSNDMGDCGAVVIWEAPEASDNCVVTAFTSTHNSGDPFPVGTTTVMLVAIDNSANELTESFEVTILDDESPVLSGVPGNLTVGNDLDVCGANVNWTAPTANDNCDNAPVITSTHGPGDLFPVGTTTVTYTVTDTDDNSSSQSFTVTVNDVQAPQLISMPTDIQQNTDAGVCGAIVEWTAPTAIDNCEAGIPTSDFQSLAEYPVGTTVVTYTVVDFYGNPTSGTFQITITDNELPEFTSVPMNVATNTDLDVCGAIVEWDAPAAEDPCGHGGITLSHTSGELFPVGLTTVELSVTDNNDNTAVTSFTITVTDDQNPEITGIPENITVFNDLDQCGAMVMWSEPSTSDNCEIISFDPNFANNSFFSVAQTVVTYTALDENDNISTASFVVTVVDNQDPQFDQIPEDITVNTDPGQCSAMVQWQDPQPFDNCNQIDSTTSTHLPGDTFLVGNTTVTYTTSDVHGNTHSQSFSVTVLDNENPEIIDIPQNITVGTDPETCSAEVTWTEPTATDNCQADISPDVQPNTNFQLGTTTVTYTAVDPSGNTVSASFDVTVVDNEAPMLHQIPADITVSNDPGDCGALVNWSEPTATDYCHALSPITSSENGGFYAVGQTVVTYTATDNSGNEASASFTITVVDVDSPNLTNMPSDITVNTEEDSDHAEVNWSGPVATDNCDLLPNLVVVPPSGSDFPIGTTVVTATATDLAGNSSTNTFEVTVVDNQNPVITNLSSDITVENDLNQCGATVSWPAHSAIDNSGNVTVTVSPESGTSFPIGPTVVTVTAVDDSGNSTTGEFTVTVLDTQLPILLGNRVDLQAVNDSGECGAEVTWSAFGVVDNCDATLVPSHNPNDFFPVGETEVVLTLTDSSDNVVIESFTVTVTDAENPAIVDPSNILVDADHSTCDATIDVPRPVTSDNCAVESVTNSFTGEANANGTYPLGDTLITWTIVDTSGNEVTAQQLITVNVDQTDCNGNGLFDVCEIGSGAATDCNSNGIPDDCETDCNTNGIPDDCDIATGASLDTNGNTIPDECETQFQRGDVNVSGSVDVTDPIFVLQYWIGTGPTPTCLDSADINDDEQIDVSDTISLLMYLFQASDPPAAPFGTCGIDPDGESGLGCDSYANCP